MRVFSPQPRFRIYASPSSYMSVLKDVVHGGTNKGDDCQKLESEIRRRFNVPFSVCVPQARMGIYWAVKAVIKPGQKVILSPYTIVDVINMVICADGVPVFADVERGTCNIDPVEVEKLIDKDTGAVLITHLHGLVCPVDRIIEICKRHHVPLIEDAAQAFGAKFNGKFAGSFGDIGIYSFGRYKNLISFYGGMVVTPHTEIQKKIRSELEAFPYMETGEIGKRVLGCLAKDIATAPFIFQQFVYRIFRFAHLHNIGFINRYVAAEPDINRKYNVPDAYFRRMTPMQARLVMSKIERVENDTSIRINCARIYHEGLSGLKELILPPLRTDGSHIYTAFPVQYSHRDALVRWLMEHRRDIGIQHLKNCAALPGFKNYFRECPRATSTSEDIILLPTYPRYTEGEIRRNIEAIHAFFRR